MPSNPETGPANVVDRLTGTAKRALGSVFRCHMRRHTWIKSGAIALAVGVVSDRGRARPAAPGQGAAARPFMGRAVDPGRWSPRHGKSEQRQSAAKG